MVCLIINTAFAGAQVVLADSGTKKILVQNIYSEPYGQGEVIVPMIEASLKDAGLTYDSLSGIAAVRGPGAFTGLRVGLAAARMIRQTLGLKSYGICSFDAMRRSYELDMESQGTEFNDVIVVLETKRLDFYIQYFCTRTDKLVSKVINQDELKEICVGRTGVIVGDAAERASVLVENFKVYNIPIPSTQALVELMNPNIDDLSPVYLRTADVTILKS